MKDRLKKMTKKDSNGCWNWQGYIKGFGYGQTTIGSRTDGTRRTTTTHRAMWIACNGEIKGGLWVLHKCDNPRCINPEHLYLGDRKQNVKDMVDRGRVTVPCLKHESHPNSKLTWSKVDEIRFIKNKTQEEISKMFNVSRRTISDVLNFVTWIPNPPKEEDNE